ncbi:Na-K-Cl cotransporter, partial [bacterium]|nr:Na-K-Cl cotransporter [bacterium]
ALYLIGFSAVWVHVFPEHNFLLVASTAWLLLLVASYISAHFAIKIQYFIMVIIGVSIVSFLFSPAQTSDSVVLVGKFENAGFWKVFAIFFPAVTGIMAGANMSGDLQNPRRSIPKGTLNAIWVTMIIYIVMAYVASRVATMAELRTDEMIMVKKAFWGPVVIAGIMGSTLSSALGSMLGAPRILQALAAQRTVPFHTFFKQKAANNEPRNAIIFTGIIIEIALVLGNLDFLASLITMFFLITYGMLNWVVFIEQSMKIISFRPSFRVPRIVPLLGGLGCLFMMFLIDPIFSVVALVIIIFIYVSLARRGLKSRYGDIRGGMFVALAERASRLAAKFPDHPLTWKPDLLVPVEDPRVWGGPLLFIRNVTYPAGSMFAFTVNTQEVEPIRESLASLLEPLAKEGILVSSAVIEDDDFLRGAGHVLQTLEGGALRPNTLFLTLGDDPQKDSMLNELISQATRHGIGSIILRQHPRMAFGMQ